MDSDWCPECGRKQSQRIVTEKCGHSKCRDCFLKESTVCRACKESKSEVNELDVVLDLSTTSVPEKRQSETDEPALDLSKKPRSSEVSTTFPATTASTSAPSQPLAKSNNAIQRQATTNDNSYLRKPRTFISQEQLRILDHSFLKDQFPSKESKKTLSKKLNLDYSSVDVWFQNKRARTNSKIFSTSDKVTTAPTPNSLSPSIQSDSIKTSISTGRKARTSITPFQQDQLEAAFRLNPFPLWSDKDYIASELDLDYSVVQVWFQNKRARSKRKLKKSALDEGFEHKLTIITPSKQRQDENENVSSDTKIFSQELQTKRINHNDTSTEISHQDSTYFPD